MELCQATGITRNQLLNYELGRAVLPLSAALAICQRLNLNVRWLGTGREPRVPFIPWPEAGIDPARIDEAAAAGMDFLSAYRQWMAAEFEEWARHETPDRAVARVMAGAPGEAFHRMSTAALQAFIADQARELRRASAAQKPGRISLLRDALAELEEQLGQKKSLALTIQSGYIDPVQIAEKLKKIRARLGLTQKDAAQRWGVPISTLRKWEQGVSAPSQFAQNALQTILRNESQPGG